MSAGFVACMIGFYVLYHLIVYPDKVKGRFLIELTVIFLVCCLPVLSQVVMTIGKTKPLSGSEAEAFARILRARVAHHVFPSTWSANAWFRAGLLVLIGAAAFVTQRITAATRTVFSFAAAVALLCALGAFFAEVVPSRHIMVLQLFRSTKFLLLFIIVFCAQHARQLWRGDLRSRAAASALIAGLVIYHHAWNASVPIFIIYGFLRGRLSLWLTTVVGTVWWVLVGAVTLPAAVPLTETWLKWAQLGMRDALLAVVVWGLFLAGLGVAWAHTRQWLGSRASDAFAGGVLVVFLACLVGMRIAANVRRFDRFSFDPLPRNTEWVEVQHWCRENTPPGTLFLTPPFLEGFRCHSHRPVFAEWKDGAPHMFNAPSAFKWWRRMGELGISSGSTEHMVKTYGALTTSHLLHLAEKYGIQYVVMPKTERLPFEKVWTNKFFVVHRISNR